MPERPDGITYSSSELSILDSDGAGSGHAGRRTRARSE
jgi:hypothetical protein